MLIEVSGLLIYADILLLA